MPDAPFGPRPVRGRLTGGWEVAARELGLSTLGIELDAAPVAVARAAGFTVLQADVAALDPLDFAPCPGVIGSPPCPTFSSAGRGAGRDLEAIILSAIADLAGGRDTRAERRREAYVALEPDTARFGVLPVPRRRRKREQHAASPVDRDRIARREAKRATAKRDAAISLLVVEPLRWALALAPRWVALEQVPPVLPLWEAMSVVLRERGYSVWTGCLSSERYGVPQTRQRAILIASLDHEVREPPATHQRYIAPRKRKRAADGEATTLFEAPEPERIVHREDRDLLPWVSMAECLQWGMTARPSVSLLAKTGGTGGHRPLEGGSGARETLDRARADGEWVDGPSPSPSVTAGGTGAGGGVEVFAGREARERAANAVRFVSNGQANATTRDVDEPAPTIATGHSTAERRWELRAGTNERDCSRPVDEPAPTIRYGARLNDVSWVREDEPPTHYDRRQEQGPRREDGSRARVRLLSVDEPAPTQQAEALAKGRDVWVSIGSDRYPSNNADAHEADAREVLRALREALGAQAYAEWESGSALPLQPPEVLRSDVLREGADGTHAAEDGEAGSPAGAAELEASWAVRAVQCAERAGRSSSQRESAGQLARELGAHLSKLPHEGSPQAGGMHDLREASDRARVVLQALQALADLGRSAGLQGQPEHAAGAATVRVSVAEAAALQSFPPGYPWEAAGTKTAAFRCVGNAVPPLLAWHVLREAANPGD